MKTCLVLLILIFGASSLKAEICGKTDDRKLAREPRVGRLVRQWREDNGRVKTKQMGTAFLIGNNCVLTCHHCLEMDSDHGRKMNRFLEFNVYGEDSAEMPALKQDRYELDMKTLESSGQVNMGNDWAVVKIKNNSQTNKSAHIVQGFYSLAKQSKLATSITVIGYGYNMENRKMNRVQQISTGAQIIPDEDEFSEADDILFHTADTKPYHSGSPIINSESAEVLGIHTGGECAVDGHNVGTKISNPQLQVEIQNCLEN